MNTFFTAVIFLIYCPIYAQVIDDFSDGNFSINPAWEGTVNDYIVNNSSELQLNNSVAATSYLSLPHGLTSLEKKEWHLTTRQEFSPSGNNFARIYLTAAAPDLASDPDGMYLQLGEPGSADAVRLYKSISGVAVELLSGATGQIASSFSIGIKVLRDSTGQWELFIDDSGGTNYVTAGVVFDSSTLLGTHSGIFQQYTISNATKFYYDDIYIGDEIIDSIPPIVLSAEAHSLSTIDLLFNEGVDQVSAENVSNYNVSPFLSINNAVLDTVNPALVHLSTAQPMTNGQTYQVSIASISDLALNGAGTQSTQLTCMVPEIPLPKDVVINEILFNPITGGSDWVEVYNNSDKFFDLYGWSLANGKNDTINDAQVISSHFLLSPECYAVVSEDTAHVLQQFHAAVEGRFLQSNLPSYNNDKGTVYLTSDGVVIDAVPYADTWHFELLNDDEGKSLERMDPNGESAHSNNWHTAAEAIGFGTPGGENSQYRPALDNGEFSYTSETVSPDNDGFEDVLQVNYKMIAPGFIGRFAVYDDRGRKIASVMESELLGVEGFFVWDGITDSGTKAAIGTYVGVFEAFHIDGGHVVARRKAFVLAGRLY